jgi:hypothetical protein
VEQSLGQTSQVGPDIHNNRGVIHTELGVRLLEVVADSLVQSPCCFSATRIPILKEFTGKFCAIAVNEDCHESVLFLNLY